MKAGVKNNVCLFIFLVLVIWASKIESQNTFRFHEEVLFSATVKIYLPYGYRKSVFNYDEGVFVSFTYIDKSTITLFQGSNVRVPLLSEKDGYIVQNTDTLSHRLTIKGVKDSLLWREDIYKDVIVYYSFINPKEKDLYDGILDSVYILKK